MRAYFTFNIVDRGEGFVFAIADAASNNLSGTLCGGTGTALGYAGNGINYPKLGLEIDTRRTTARADPGTSAKPDHLAFVYWGTTATTADDNNHGVPAATAISGNQPLNPRGLGTLSIQAATWSANTVTITTTATHYLIPNQSITISGVSPAAYNGTYQITPINATRFSYSLPSNPGLYASGGAVISPFYGISTVKSSDARLPYDGVLPLNTDIHVRIDIIKSHVGATATYDLKAYVVSAPDSCASIANLKNLSFDMDDLTCNPAPTISQDKILINDISGFGEAMSSVYVGFTNGQTNNVAGEQSITISNFLLRSQ
jgi:hypothetical protein